MAGETDQRVKLTIPVGAFRPQQRFGPARTGAASGVKRAVTVILPATWRSPNGGAARKVRLVQLEDALEQVDRQ